MILTSYEVIVILGADNLEDIAMETPDLNRILLPASLLLVRVGRFVPGLGRL